MGADAALSDEATDWRARPADPPGSSFSWPQREAAAPVAAVARVAVQPGSAPPMAAAARAPAINTATPVKPAARAPAAARPPERPVRIEAATLADLEAQLRAFDGCGLKSTATNLCFFRGAPSARLMIIGEAPGREEDLEGRPFVGRDGQLLDKMLAAIGFSEAQVHMTNVVYWRPPGNRPPTAQEASICRPFLDRQIELVGPEVVLLLGGGVTKPILGSGDGIMKLRGQWTKINAGGREFETMPTLNFTYLRGFPASKRQAWLDLLLVKDRLKSLLQERKI